MGSREIDLPRSTIPSNIRFPVLLQLSSEAEGGAVPAVLEAGVVLGAEEGAIAAVVRGRRVLFQLS